MMKAEFIELSNTYKNQGIFKSDTVILAEVVEKMMTTGFDKVHANMAQLLQLVSVMSDLISKMEHQKHVSIQVMYMQIPL